MEKCTLLEMLYIYDKLHGNIQYKKHYEGVKARGYLSFTCSYVLSRAQIGSLINLIKSQHICMLELWEVPGFTVADYKAILCQDTNYSSIMLRQLSTSLTFDIMREMLRMNPNLTELKIRNSLYDMTGDQIQSVFTSKFNKISKLQIRQHYTLTTQAVNSILLANMQLKNFNFEMCPHVEERKLVRKSKQCTGWD